MQNLKGQGCLKVKREYVHIILQKQSGVSEDHWVTSEETLTPKYLIRAEKLETTVDATFRNKALS
jgi:hypothetical protein